MGGRRRCCCGCLFFTDDFYRLGGDTTDLGDNWLEVNGEWSIASSKLSEEGNANALAVVTREMPMSPGALSESPWAPYMYVAVTIVNEAIGDTFWILGMWADESHYVKGKYTRVDYDHATLELYSNTGGGETLLDSYTFELADKDVTERGLQLCLSDTITLLTTSDTSNCHAIAPQAVIITNGEHAGVGHENNDVTVFDNFFMYQLFKVDRQCYPCGDCFCDDVTPPVVPPRYLYAVFEGDGTTDCDVLDGIEVVLEYNRCTQPIATWAGTINDGCLTGSDATMELICDESWTLRITEAIGKVACAPVGPMGYLDLVPIEYSCDPLYFVYTLAIENSGGGAEDSFCPEPCRPCGDGGGAENPKMMRWWITITD